jgi:sulfur relay (sulfurtransferase) complex TusBCD TusD component (DsrE family)
MAPDRPGEMHDIQGNKQTPADCAVFLTAAPWVAAARAALRQIETAGPTVKLVLLHGDGVLLALQQTHTGEADDLWSRLQAARQRHHFRLAACPVAARRRGFLPVAREGLEWVGLPELFTAAAVCPDWHCYAAP